jgi:hypothetical protein
MFRSKIEKDSNSYLIRFWWNWIEFAYVVIGLRGLALEIEFPSDWHERRLGWVRLGFGLFTVSLAFPWRWTVPDHYQCSGPTYGFSFFADGLHLHWGKQKGKRTDPFTIIGMPWRWNHRLHEVMGEPETHPYRYVLRSGKVQERTATIYPERRVWTRAWLPWRMECCTINVEFSDEVGERSGSWKGGVLGCSYDMLSGESPLDALRRMERERKFN